MGSFINPQTCQVCTTRNSSVDLQKAILGDQPDLPPPRSRFSLSLTESDLQENLGPRIQRSVRLEAAVRMLADNLIVYESMDQVFNNRRLELLSYQNQDHSPEDQAPPPSFPITNEYTVMGINEDLLLSLDIDTLDLAHMHMSKSYNVMTSKTFSHYLNEVTVLSHSRAYLLPYKRKVEYHEKWNGLYVTMYQREQLVATAAMNEKLTKHIRHNFYKQGEAYNTPRQPQPNFLSGIAEILMTSGALPDLKTFNLLIRQLNLYRLPVPARMALDALLLSDLTMNNMVYTTALRLAISTNDKEGFMRLSRVFDLNSVTVPDGIDSPLNDSFWERFHPIKMSSYRNHDWPVPGPSDEALRRRFFTSPGDRENKLGNLGKPTIKVYTTLISGMVRFGWHWWIDVTIRKMAAEGFPLTLEVLTLNMDAAAATKDAAKARWTWAEILKLPLPGPDHANQQPPLDKDLYGSPYRSMPFDKEAYLSCAKAAKAVDDMTLLMQIEDYYRAFQVHQVRFQIELHEQLNKRGETKPSKPKLIPFFSASRLSKNKKDVSATPTPPETEHNTESPVATQSDLLPVHRMALSPSIKNITSILFGGALVWNPQLATGVQEGGSQAQTQTQTQTQSGKPPQSANFTTSLHLKNSAQSRANRNEALAHSQGILKTWYEDL